VTVPKVTVVGHAVGWMVDGVIGGPDRYVGDDLDHVSLARRNAATMLQNGVAPETVLFLLADLAEAAGLCPICARPRGISTKGTPMTTCGGRSCRGVLGGRGGRGRPKPSESPGRRRKISASMRAYHASQREQARR
jgi:hypothetical protein